MINIFSPDGSVDVLVNGASAPYVTASHDTRAVEGDVRYNCGVMEVYSNGSWLSLGCDTVELQLGPYEQEILAWAEQKMLEERKEAELLKKHPALKNAKEKYETIKALVEND